MPVYNSILKKGGNRRNRVCSTGIHGVISVPPFIFKEVKCAEVGK
jgi:hypothetical protein